jgi:hypothetical protein
MSRISEAIFPMVILLLALNSSFLMISNLPSNTSATEIYGANLGLTQQQIDSVTRVVLDINADANSLANTIDRSQSSNVWVSTETPETPTGFFEILYGVIGAGYLFLSMVYYFFFGFTIWIDLFLPPSITVFFYLGSIFKGVLLIIQVIGILNVMALIIGSWRGSR